MALTKWYLHNVAAPQSPSSGKKSTALPNGTLQNNVGGTAQESLVMTTKIGTSQTSIAKSSLAQTAAQSEYNGRWSSFPLAAQTIAALTWTFQCGVSESNASANSFTALSIYIWRPSTGAVVGYIYDAVTALGVEYTTAETSRTVTVSGASVTTQAGDILVVEYWIVATQAAATAFTNTIFYDGTTEGSATTNAAFLSVPAAVGFGQIPSDSISITESVSKAIKKSLSDTRSFTESSSKSLGKSIIESVTFNDILSKATNRSISDNLNSLDKLAKSIGKSLLDNSSTIDTDSKSISKTDSDTLTLTDFISELRSKTVLDNISLSDSTSKSITKSISDIMSISDQVSKSTSRYITDSPQISDTLSKSIVKYITDSLLSTDSLSKSDMKSMSDGIVSNDSLSKLVNKMILDNISTIDFTSRSESKSVFDSSLLSDQLSKIISKNISDILIDNESAQKDIGKVVLDNLSSDDISTPYKNTIINVIDSILGTDVLQEIIHRVIVSGGITTQTPGVFNPYYGGIRPYDEKDRELSITSPILILLNNRIRKNTRSTLYNESKMSKNDSLFIINDKITKHSRDLILNQIKMIMKSKDIIILKDNGTQKYIDIIIKNDKNSSGMSLIPIKVPQHTKSTKSTKIVDHESLLKMIEDIQLVEIIG